MRAIKPNNCNRRDLLATARNSLGVWGVWALGGCSIINLQNVDLDVYTLSPKNTFSDQAPSVNWQLLVDHPQSATGLNKQLISLRVQPLEVLYYDHAIWVEPLPDLIQRLLIESFENSQKIPSVGRSTIGLQSDFRIRFDIREFQAEYRDDQGNWGQEGSPPVINATFSANLILAQERRIVAVETFRARLRANSLEFPDIIKAFDQALGKILKRIVNWALIEGERQHRQSLQNTRN